jgi:hypothetical protein
VPVRTNVYVDAFNLYYRAVKGTPYKWLNIDALIHAMYSFVSINKIRYFSANIRPRPDDPTKAQRQEVYFRALGTIPHLTIHKGHYAERIKSMPLAESPTHECVRVISTEEKGSDVNLASYLLVDAFKGDYEVAIVLSNDSDLEEPIRLVKSEFGLPVYVLNPERDPKSMARQLLAVADNYRVITTEALSKCQFPASLVDSTGSFLKPSTW